MSSDIGNAQMDGRGGVDPRPWHGNAQ